MNKKTSFYFRKGFLSFLVFMMYAGVLFGQDAEASKKVEIKTSVESRHFTFQVQSVSPMKGGGLIQQTPGYSVIVRGDTLICYLPYFGRLYQSNMGSTDAGLKFTSLQFEYKVEAWKKKGWKVSVDLKNSQSVTQMRFTMFDNGKADVFVNCIDREPINYNGYISTKDRK